jgi:hypothetical protein
MDQKSVVEIAKQFGLTIESAGDPESEPAYKIYKGAKQVFAGNENVVRDFLSTYEAGRPGLLDGSMYGYLE